MARKPFAMALLIVLALGLLMPSAAYAHRMIWNVGVHTNAGSAIAIEDPSISQVIYHDVTEAAPQIWLTFDAKAGQSLYMQLGVPVLDRLVDYRPAMALIGPGLPEPEGDLPFEVPSGMGVLVFPSGTPQYFLEEFTGTEDWIMREEEVDLPATGRYYFLGYEPEPENGKLWISLGRKEHFGLRDILTINRVIDAVRAFHETTGSPYSLLRVIQIALLAALAAVMGIAGYLLF